MNTTTTINPTGKGSSDKKKTAAAFAATAVAGVGAGMAGASVMNGEKEVETLVEGAGSSENTAETSQTSQPITQPQETTNVGISETVSPATPDSVEIEPEPITVSEMPVTGNSGEAVDGPSDEPVGPSQPIEDVQPEPEVVVDNPVNPDEIADAIMSGEQIDPNDIDMANVINFDEIGTVYTVDGESYTAASFHDTAGNSLIMVDVDGDDVFDVITDGNGNMIAEVPAGVTVDDAEMNIADDGTYIAHNDNEDTDEFGADTISQDILA